MGPTPPEAVDLIELEVVDLIELHSGADDTTSHGFVDASWASRWPAEEIWVAARR